MSLRSVHIAFIITALAFMVFLLSWSGRHLLHGEDGMNFVLAVSASLSILAGVPYLFWFIRKTKSLV